MEAIIRPEVTRGRLDLSTWLGVTLGIVMPVISAALYPVYMHQMQPAWAEWTRLMELPFVVCELVITHLAIRQGYSEAPLWARLPKDARWALGLLLVGLTVSSTVVSKNPAASVTMSLVTLIHLRFAGAIYFLASTRALISAPILMRWLGIGLVVLAALIVCKFTFPPSPENVPGGRIEWGSALPGFISVRHFGSWSGAIAAGLAISVLYGRGDRLTVGLYMLALGMTCWSGTRAAVLAVVVVVALAIATLRRMPTMRAMSLLMICSVIGLLVGTGLAPAGESEFGLFRWGSYAEPEAIASGRVELWKQTFGRWRDAPWFGWGTGSTFWEVKIAMGWTHTQPHNVILQFLISWGIVGAAGGLWLLGRAIAAVHASGFRDAALRPLAGMLYALLFMSLLEGMLHYPRFIMLIMVGFAMILTKKHAAT